MIQSDIPNSQSRGRDRRSVSRIAGPDLVDDSLPQVRDPSATRIGGHTIETEQQLNSRESSTIAWQGTEFDFLFSLRNRCLYRGGKWREW